MCHVITSVENVIMYNKKKSCKAASFDEFFTPPTKDFNLWGNNYSYV